MPCCAADHPRMAVHWTVVNLKIACSMPAKQIGSPAHPYPCMVLVQMFYKSARVEYHPVGVVSNAYSLVFLHALLLPSFPSAMSSCFGILHHALLPVCPVCADIAAASLSMTGLTSHLLVVPLTYLHTSHQSETLVQVGAIVPWNYPFHNVFNPLSAAVFAGNAIVIKVSRGLFACQLYSAGTASMVACLQDRDPVFAWQFTGNDEAFWGRIRASIGTAT